MRLIPVLASLAIIVLLAGCNGKTGAVTTTTAATETTAPGTSLTTTSSASVTTAPETTIATTTTATTTTPPVTTTTSSVTTTAAVPGSDKAGLSAYLGALMPVIQRHTATKQAKTGAETTFTLAYPGMASIEIYRDALEALQPAVANELADISDITPPPAHASFHATIIDAISQQKEGIDGNVTYYTKVLETGTGELEELTASDSASLESNRLWYEVILPKLDQLTAEVGS